MPCARVSCRISAYIARTAPPPSSHLNSRPFYPNSILLRKPNTPTRPLSTTITTTAKMPATAGIGTTVLAQADTYETVEGNIYFPPSSIQDDSMLEKSSTTTKCPWKGTASYYTLNVDGKKYKDAAWYYPEPKEKAENIKDYVAFCESSSSPFFILWEGLSLVLEGWGFW